MLPKGAYNPKQTEEEMLDFWLKSGFYKPEFSSKKKESTACCHAEALPACADREASDTSKTEDTLREPQCDKRETYTNILPPPNANGNLHLGHMSGYAYQDLMGRYQRMIGKKVLLLPGKDHAGIQTEVVFEKLLEKKGKSKKDLGRESFYKACYNFCMEHSEVARSQEKSLGLSADFERELFTLDPRIVDSVLQTFIDFHQDELIYRDKRLINWCPRCYTALADIDTEYKDSIGNFVYFKYGFLEPAEYAIHVKNTYGGKNVKAIVERYEGMKYTDKKGKTFDWEFGYYGRLEGDISPGDGMDLDVLFVGYEDGIKPETEIEGKAIGIMMRLDEDYKLIIANPEASEEQVTSELDFLFKEFAKYFAGTHIIKFADYPEDKYYTNGFVMGTVRPETKFGDTAIAVNPKDKRYTEYVGKEFDVLTVNGPAKIKMIADNAVDKDFGTGALKITPAHAKDDWDIATRHPEVLPEKQCINFDGKLNHLCGKYEGLYANQARKAILEEMKETGILVHLEENYKNRTQICERCKHNIEPLISYQWFLNTKPLKAKAKDLVESGITNIMPEGKKKVYMNWMDTPEDWCITRQLWWGYRVPVWYKQKPEEFITESGEVKEKIGDKIMHSAADYKEFIEVSQKAPDGIRVTAVRHGETDANIQGILQGQNDTPLNPKGRTQAEKVAKTINSDDYDLIIASPQARAFETAQIIAEETSLELTTDDRIKEKDFGEYTGRSQAELKKEQGVERGHQLKMPDDAEEVEDVEKRVREFIEDLKTNYDGKRFLIITHYGVIRIFHRELGGLSYEQSRTQKIKNCQKIDFYINSGSEWHQDEDVLDTWFSSGQWPAVTLLANEGDFETYYPTQVMETGWDILIFWITRMMLLCPYKAEKSFGEILPLNKGELEGVNEETSTGFRVEARNDNLSDKDLTPFEDVYLHGLVLDKKGQKMSKSKGNGIDPFEMMQKYGTDALRLSFIVGNKVGQNYRLYEEKIKNFRNYCNKIWNVSKFTLMNLENAGFDPSSIEKDALNLEKDDKAMINHLSELTAGTSRNMNKFNFGIAAQNLYDSVWHTFADEYLEQIKTRIYTKDRDGNPINTSPAEQESKKAALWVLWKSLDTYLKLLHPFIPFITERIWKELPKSEEESETLMYAAWPQSE